MSMPEFGDDDSDGSTERGVATKTRPKTKKPSMYRVLLMNDDYTPMEFVVSVLMKIFNKSADEATTIMLAVHKNGIGVCGVFTCLLYTSPSPRDATLSRMPSSA